MSDQNNMPENGNVQGQNSQANGQNAQNAASQSSKKVAHQGIPSVSGKKRKKNKNAALLLWAAIALGVGLTAIAASKMGVFDKGEATAKNVVRAADLTSNKSVSRSTLPVFPEEEKKEEKKTDLIPLEQKPEITSYQPAQVQVQPHESIVLSHNDKVEPTLDDLKFAAPMMGQISSNSSGSGGVPGGYTDADRQAVLDSYNKNMSSVSSMNGLSAENKAPNLSSQVSSMTTPVSVASVISNPSLTLSKGTVIECILETRVDTTVPGMTSCIIPQNVYSMNGRVLLIEKGTKAIGEYQGSVQNGLDRIFMLWSELRTPEGVAVNISSPTADALGGAGVGGYVDHHWWRRFGSALMFSMVSDAFKFGMTKAEKSSNTSVRYDTTEDGMNEIIKEAMRQSGNIPPTLIKNPGERVSIFVARDVDFSKVYNLKRMHE